MIEVNWDTFKQFVDERNISIQYVVTSGQYHMRAADAFFVLSCELDEESAEETDFINNYQANANKKLSDDDGNPVNGGSAYAIPNFRTKRDATPALVSVNPNSTNDMDYYLTEEKYVSGGTIVFQDSQHGDYISACIYDKDGVIPEPYRAVLCENWPIVATYVIKEWLCQSGEHKIDTRPLNAKITAGLYLRVSYTATAVGTARSVGVNYDLTKKL